jgi:hypothetical protein
MNKADQETPQPIGLDVGTSRIVVARGAEKKYQYESQLNAFLTLPNSALTESLLQRENVFHDVRGAELVVTGNDASRFAEVFNVEMRRPMANGILNPQEPYSLPVVRSIITRMLGRASGEGQKVFFSVPGPVTGTDAAISFHQASISRILSDLGYAPTPITEGLAVVFGELADSNFSGIGISCGSGLCNVCMAVLSVPVVSFSVPKAGDFIDSQAAVVTGDIALRMRVHKEKAFYLNGLIGDRVHDALNVYYQEVLVNLVEALRNHISSAERLTHFDQSIPLVLSGGTAMPKGFLEHFKKALREHELPVKLSEVRLSADPLNSTARGALMAALC